MRSLLIACLVLALSSLGMTYAPLTTPINYNNLQPGDSYDQMLKTFGKPRYDLETTAWGQPITYYYYKDNTRIGINPTTKKIVDMQIRSDYYTDTINNRLFGTTTYKLEQLYGKNKRQPLEDKYYYPYRYQDERAFFQLDPNLNAVTGLRLTTLPLEQLDTEDYLPDEATSEGLNPLIADKRIDTTALVNISSNSNSTTTGAKIEKFPFHINYKMGNTK